MSDVQVEEKQQGEKKKGFFGRLSDKMTAKLRALNPNTIGWIILVTIGVIAVGSFAGMITGLINAIRAGEAGGIPSLLIGFIVGMAFLFGLGAMVFHMMKTLNEELRFKTDYSVDIQIIGAQTVTGTTS
jgi:hypothetical protein